MAAGSGRVDAIVLRLSRQLSVACFTADSQLSRRMRAERIQHKRRPFHTGAAHQGERHENEDRNRKLMMRAGSASAWHARAQAPLAPLRDEQMMGAATPAGRGAASAVTATAVRWTAAAIHAAAVHRGDAESLARSAHGTVRPRGRDRSTWNCTGLISLLPTEAESRLRLNLLNFRHRMALVKTILVGTTNRRSSRWCGTISTRRLHGVHRSGRAHSPPNCVTQHPTSSS